MAKGFDHVNGLSYCFVVQASDPSESFRPGLFSGNAMCRNEGQQCRRTTLDPSYDLLKTGFFASQDHLYLRLPGDDCEDTRIASDAISSRGGQSANVFLDLAESSFVQCRYRSRKRLL